MTPRTTAAGPEEILYRRRSTAIASRIGGRDGNGRETIAATGTGMAIHCNNAELLGGRGDTTKERNGIGMVQSISIEL